MMHYMVMWKRSAADNEEKQLIAGNIIRNIIRSANSPKCAFMQMS